MLNKVKQGKNNRAKGKRFELAVRKQLEDKGWIICKWTNQIDVENNKLIPAKSKYNPFTKRIMNEGSGFPDFVCMRKNAKGNLFKLIFVEVKINGYLDQIEKKKCEWIENNISKVYIASKGKKRGKIVYRRFKK